MRRFLSRLFLWSFRWVAPTLVLFFWLVNLLNGTPFGRASALFPAFLLWSLWTTVALGNMHDKPTRDLLASTVGSPARLHNSVWSAVGLMSAPLIALVTMHSAVFAGEPRAIIGTFLSTTCATMIGLALGSWLHQPVTNNRSVTIFGSVALFIGVILLPPITATHDSLSEGRLTPIFVLGSVCCFGLVALTTASSRWANTRASSC